MSGDGRGETRVRQTAAAASIPEGGEASIQPHPAHPGSQGSHQEQSLNPGLQRLQASISCWSTYDDYLQCVSVNDFFPKGHKMLLHSSRCFHTDIYLTFVPCSKAAYSHNMLSICFVFVCMWCWNWLSVHNRCIIIVNLDTEGHIHKESWFTTCSTKKPRTEQRWTLRLINKIAIFTLIFLFVNTVSVKWHILIKMEK